MVLRPLTISILLTLYLGGVSTLPIADLRASFNISLPVLIVLPPKIVNIPTDDERFKDVARKIKEAQKSPSRYGKRSVPTEYSDDAMSDQVEYSAGVLPTYNGITRQPFFPNGYSHFYYTEKSRTASLPSILGFDGHSFAVMTDLFRYRKKLDLIECTEAEEEQKIYLDQLLGIAEVMENQQNTAPLRNINKEYLSKHYTRGRPGKRSDSLQENLTEEIRQPGFFWNTLGEKNDDARAWPKRTTVAEKTPAHTKHHFRRGTPSMTLRNM
ncbi:unnamed protein product [Caenorhabditis brenneri]